LNLKLSVYGPDLFDDLGFTSFNNFHEDFFWGCGNLVKVANNMKSDNESDQAKNQRPKTGII
jgi:hypothetical protein